MQDWSRSNYKSTNVRDISDKLTSADLNAIDKWLTNNKLFLNTDKTNVMLIDNGAKLRNIQGNEFSVNIDGEELDNVTKAKCSGVLIDNELCWHCQVKKVIQNVFCKIALIRRRTPYLDFNTLNVLFKSFIQLLFDYCSIAWYARFRDDCALDVLHKRCASLGLFWESIISPLLISCFKCLAGKD